MTNLRKVGGSVMLAVPRAILDVLNLRAGAAVSIDVEAGRLIVQPRGRPRYALDELLAQCDPSAEFDAQDRDWLDAPAVGRELM